MMGAASAASSASATRPWTVEDDIAFSSLLRVDSLTPAGSKTLVSPDGRHVLLRTQRGMLERNVLEETLWVFDTAGLKQFLESPDSPSPAVTPLARVADREGSLASQSVINVVRWLDDSSGVLFTAYQSDSRCRYRRLYRVSLAEGKLEPLTPDEEDVREFSAAGADFAYIVDPPELLKADRSEVEKALDDGEAVPLLGKAAYDLYNGNRKLSPFPRQGLWAVIDGRRFPVIDHDTGRPVSLALGQGMVGLPLGISLSPDGRRLAVIVYADSPPEKWKRYKAPPGGPYQTFPMMPFAYHLIDLERGAKTLLLDAPEGHNRDWNSNCHTARWSADGTRLLLSDVFTPLDSPDPDENARREDHPNIAVYDLATRHLSPIYPVRAGLDKARYGVADLRFEDNRTVVVDFQTDLRPGLPESMVFQEGDGGRWSPVPAVSDPRTERLSYRLDVNEAAGHPPQLVASAKSGGSPKVVFDPNPQLADIDVRPVEPVHWTDATGFEQTAGLIMPADAGPARRVPLVIQTHGFADSRFLYDGFFHGNMAARAMAAHGIAVVQVNSDPTGWSSPREGPDQAASFAALVGKLADERRIDSTRVGAIGFSRTVYHVIDTLTIRPKLLAAASVTDGVMFGYLESILAGGRPIPVDDAVTTNEGSPWTEAGLANWMKHSAGFHMDAVQAPLLLLQPGMMAALYSWQPYAALTALRKPVDFIVMPRGTHPMSNPHQRWLAETVNVDWFRFWLMGEEDPDPKKAAQYARWRELRKLQLAEHASQDSGRSG